MDTLFVYDTIHVMDTVSVNDTVEILKAVNNDIASQSVDYIEKFIAIVFLLLAFGLGLLANRINERRKEKKRFKNIKELIQVYLCKLLNGDLELLKKAYQDCVIEKGDSKAIHSFEDFNTTVYKANSISDYYAMLNNNEKFNMLFSIFSMIEYISLNLPHHIHLEYINSLIIYYGDCDKSSFDKDSSKYYLYNKKLFESNIKLKVEEVSELERYIKDYLDIQVDKSEGTVTVKISTKESIMK